MLADAKMWGILEQRALCDGRAKNALSDASGSLAVSS